jgi:tetratricopeptide (TPR) repeat protein
MEQMTSKSSSVARLQLILALAAIVLFALLYFGLDTKPSKRAEIEKTRALATTVTDFESILNQAKEKLSSDAQMQIAGLEGQLETTKEDTAKAEVLKRLSGEWFRAGFPEVAGFYAEKVAEVENTAEAWSIAGTTYNYGIQSGKDDIVRSFCFEHAVSSFENAVSLAPDEVSYQLNLALTYVAKPPQDNPMKGILMLRRLNEENPENVSVLTQLGRLAIRTGQIDKAIERLEKAIQLEPENLQANCLLANAYEQAEQVEKARKYGQICEELKR